MPNQAHALKCYRCGTDNKADAKECWRKGCRCTVFYRGRKPVGIIAPLKEATPAEGYGTPARARHLRIRRAIG